MSDMTGISDEIAATVADYRVKSRARIRSIKNPSREFTRVYSYPFRERRTVGLIGFGLDPLRGERVSRLRLKRFPETYQFCRHIYGTHCQAHFAWEDFLAPESNSSLHLPGRRSVSRFLIRCTWINLAILPIVTTRTHAVSFTFSFSLGERL